jgi:transketolase
MRNEFADELTKLGDTDPRLMMLSGDIGNRLFDKFRAKHPTRFVNCGVAEQNMMGVAAGLALSGLRPVAYTITPFVTTRCLEQIRVDVCYHHAPVMVVSVGAGLAYAGLGPTHHACEDISFLRSIPGMIVCCPGDAWEVRAAMRAALRQDSPVYIRMGKKGEPHIHSGVPADFAFGRAITMRPGDEVCLVSTGNILPEVMHAADDLAKHGHSVRVLSMHTVKPLDVAALADALGTCRLVATLEEHSPIGGLGAAVAEWMVDSGTALPPLGLMRFHTGDAFFRASGEQEYAREQLGLTGHQIAARIEATLHGKATP